MILDLDRLHEPLYAARGQGVSTRVLVGVLQRFDFDRSTIIVVAQDERHARLLRFEAALVAEALGFWSTPSAATLAGRSLQPPIPGRVLYVHERGCLSERMLVRFSWWNRWAEDCRGSDEPVAFDPPGLGVMWEQAGKVPALLTDEARAEREAREMALGLNPWWW